MSSSLIIPEVNLFTEYQKIFREGFKVKTWCRTETVSCKPMSDSGNPSFWNTEDVSCDKPIPTSGGTYWFLLQVSIGYRSKQHPV